MKASARATAGATARRRGVATAAMMAVGLLLGVAGAAAQVTGVDSIGVTVADVDRSVTFYRDLLGFERVSDIDMSGNRWDRLHGIFGLRIRFVRLRLGDEALELIEYLTPRGRPIPGDARSNDLWFQHVAIVVSDIDRAYERLRTHGVAQISPAPQRLPDWNPAAGGIRAFYFKDPDGHPLELLQFPPGKGESKWHRPSDRLFLGIDHTAIVVADTAQSLTFYRDRLGLRVAGTSENYGPEQEQLNNVVGARLHITTLRARRGPGVELLEYVAPGGARSVPPDARANDLLHAQIRVFAASAEDLFDQLAKSRTRLISASVVTFGQALLGFSKAALVRDPDGHAVQVVER